MTSHETKHKQRTAQRLRDTGGGSIDDCGACGAVGRHPAVPALRWQGTIPLQRALKFEDWTCNRTAEIESAVHALALGQEMFKILGLNERE